MPRKRTTPISGALRAHRGGAGLNRTLSVDEVRELKACISNLISVVSLPALWSGRDPSQIGSTLLDALVAMLRLDFAYLRLQDPTYAGPLIELLQVGKSQGSRVQCEAVGRVLDACLNSESRTSGFRVPSPVGEGQISIAVSSLGIHAEVGALLAGSNRTDFPTETEGLVFDVAANQAVIAFHEAQRFIEQKRIAEELDRRVAQRTREVVEREAKIRRLVDANVVGIFFWDFQGHILEANDAFLRIVGYEREDLVSGRLDWTDLTPPDWRDRDEQASAEVKASGSVQPYEKQYFRKDGSRVPVLVGAASLEQTGNQGVAFVLDLSDYKQAEALLAGEKRILEMVAKGDPLSEILDSLCRLVEEQASGVLASILLLEGNRLRHGSAPSLPNAYSDLIDGLVIGPSAGSCGTAAYRGEQVIVEDIATDPLWAAYRDLALPHSLRACWSMPVISSQGKVIATFTMYHREPRRPSPHDQEIIKQITHLAEVAIERKLTYEQLKRGEAYLAEAQKLTHTGSWAWDPSGKKSAYWSEEMFRIFGLVPQPNAPDGEEIRRLVHPDDFNRISERIVREAAEKADFVEDQRLVLADGALKHVQVTGHPVVDATGQLVEYVGTMIDVTERKRAEEERHAHVWFLESMDQINRAVQGTNDIEQVMSNVLNVVLSIFACDRAWLVYPCDPESLSCRTVMEHTRPGFPGTFALGIDVPMDAELTHVHRLVRASSGPVRVGPGSDTPVPAEIAERFSVQSQILIAVYPKLDRPYLFGLDQCTYGRTWTREEEELLQAICRRLTDTLTSLLMFRNLQQSESRLAEAERIAHVGYWARDLDTDRLAWSDETYRIFGLQPRERAIDLVGFQERIHPEDRQFVIRAAAEAVGGGMRYNAEYRLVRPGGEVRVVHSQGDVKRDESGRPHRIFGTIQDITDRKRAETALRRSEAYLAEAQSLSHTGSWAFNATAEKYIYWSEEMFRIWGFDPQQPIPDRSAVFERLHPEDRDRVRESLQKTLREKADFSYEFRTVLPDGTLKYIHSSGHPILRADGEIVELLGTHVDVTYRKRAEEERERLRQLEADLAHLNRVSMMGELTASLSHELKQPITAAVTNATTCLRWLARAQPDLQEVRGAANRIVEDARRAGEIIDRIRSLYKKSPARRELVDVNAIVREMLVLLRGEANRRSISMRTELAFDLPKITADRVQLQQVFMNLMLNGIEAMKDGGGELTMKSELRRDGQVMISVSDTGVGLPAHKADLIFNAFFTTKPQGSGMGLAITRSIVESHGGRLWATANSGPGATFHFTLPTASEVVKAPSTGT